MFATRIPRKSASFQEPKVIVSTPNTNRIPFGMVSVFARMMLAYERLERWRGSSPRASKRLAASASVRPTGAASVAVPIFRRYPVGGINPGRPERSRRGRRIAAKRTVRPGVVHGLADRHR